MSKILIIEDEVAIAELEKDYLELAGFQVSLVNEGTEGLAKAGFDMIGIDNSEEMLEIAMEKREESGLDILYLLQDMREFELYGTVQGVVSICDSMNYILEDEDLMEVFRLVHNYLDDEGIFIFDMNTMYKYEEILADNTFAEDREESSFIWGNYYDEEDEINPFAVDDFYTTA